VARVVRLTRFRRFDGTLSQHRVKCEVVHGLDGTCGLVKVDQWLSQGDHLAARSRRIREASSHGHPRSAKRHSLHSNPAHAVSLLILQPSLLPDQPPPLQFPTSLRQLVGWGRLRIARSTGVAADQGKTCSSYAFAPSSPWNTRRNTGKFVRGVCRTKIALEATGIRLPIRPM
jgi:hypothetical protein